MRPRARERERLLSNIIIMIPADETLAGSFFSCRHFANGCSVPVRTIGRSAVKLVFIGPFKEDPVLLVSRCRLISAGPLPGKPKASCKICDWAAFKIKHISVVLLSFHCSQKQPSDDDNEFRLNPQPKHICFSLIVATPAGCKIQKKGKKT